MSPLICGQPAWLQTLFFPFEKSPWSTWGEPVAFPGDGLWLFSPDSSLAPDQCTSDFFFLPRFAGFSLFDGGENWLRHSVDSILDPFRASSFHFPPSGREVFIFCVEYSRHRSPWRCVFPEPSHSSVVLEGGLFVFGPFPQTVRETHLPPGFPFYLRSPVLRFLFYPNVVTGL